MRAQSTPPISCPSNSDDQNEPGKATRVLVSLAAGLLVISSAGMGCYYAWSQSQGHGPILAGLAVAMALGLELCKPFAFEAIFSSLRRLAIGQALAMAVLASLAVAYSLSAELSLIATSRGDAVAQRAANARAANSQEKHLQRVEAELAGLGLTRPIGEIAADMQSVLTAHKIEACEGWLPTKARTVCAEQVAPLKAELARAARREALERDMQALGTQAPGVSITADPGAKALAVYLAALGLSVPADMLSEYLVLIAVLALEIGSALSVVLVKSVSTPVRRSMGRIAPADDHKPGKAGLSTVPDTLDKALPSSPRAKPRSATETLITAALSDSGGKLSDATVRGLASKIGARKSTVHNALAGLMAAGIVARDGEDIVLVAEMADGRRLN